jgi:hypothetical protein
MVQLPKTENQTEFLTEIKRRLHLPGDHSQADPQGFYAAGYTRITDGKGKTLLFPLEEHRKAESRRHHGEGRRVVPQHLLQRRSFDRRHGNTGFRPAALMAAGGR